MIFAADLHAPEGPVALADGSWLIVEGGKERGCVTRISPNGTSRETIAMTGRPNGLAVDAAGTISVAESKYPSLVRVSPLGEAEVVVTQCEGETLTGNIYRYGWTNGRIGHSRVLFGNVISPDAPPGWKGPDGMAFDEDGQLYVAVFGQQDITVLDRQGAVVGRIATAGRLPTNVAFALSGNKCIYVTEYEFGRIEMFDCTADGLLLLAGPERVTG